MIKVEKCPVCKGDFGECRNVPADKSFWSGYDCDGCGRFEISREASINWFKPDGSDLTPIQRAALSHRLRTASDGNSKLHLTSEWVERFIADARLPSLSEQASNLITIIGDHVSTHGRGFWLDSAPDVPRVGSINSQMLNDLRTELIETGVLKLLEMGQFQHPRTGDRTLAKTLSLTLSGWDRYQDEKTGRFAGRYGFVAMKFNDESLDELVNEVIKPAVRKQIGYELNDLRDVSRAGVIDNIMRTQIRDAAFVLADLTHDNSGAYWEAGYAEGLGKPVIYLCEKSKFDSAKTHFDVNHCTTVTWTPGETDRFIDTLIATLRRSLNLFPIES